MSFSAMPMTSRGWFKMQRLYLIIWCLLCVPLSGCSWILEQEQKAVDWKANLVRPAKPLTPPPRLLERQTTTGVAPTTEKSVVLPPATYPQPMSSEEVQQQYCDWARTQFSLPILFNREQKNAATSKLGKDEAAKLFWPVAKANNTFRCLCGTPEEKKLAKCG